MEGPPAIPVFFVKDSIVPRVIIETKPEWFPPEDSNPHDIQSSATGQQWLTFTLREPLKEIVARAMTAQRFPTSADEVVVNFVKLHSHATNAADISIIVSPMWNEQREAMKTRIHQEICSRVGALISHRQSFIDVRMPRVDVELLFMRGVGASLDPRGQIAATW